MSRDIVVYAKRAEAITSEALLAALRAADHDVVWTPAFSRQPHRLMGTLDVAGTADAANTVSLSGETVAAEDAVELAESLSPVGVLAREGLLATRMQYLLSVSWDPSPACLHILADVIDELARVGDGVIYDAQKSCLVSRSEYRQMLGLPYQDKPE